LAEKKIRIFFRNIILVWINVCCHGNDETIYVSKARPKPVEGF